MEGLTSVFQNGFRQTFGSGCSETQQVTLYFLLQKDFCKERITMNLRNTSVEDKLSFPDLKRLVFVVYQEKFIKSYHYVCIFSATHENEDLPCPFFFSFFSVFDHINTL